MDGVWLTEKNFTPGENLPTHPASDPAQSDAKGVSTYASANAASIRVDFSALAISLHPRQRNGFPQRLDLAAFTGAGPLPLTPA